jgi:uncharacterized protein YeaO (DUF488 family)
MIKEACVYALKRLSPEERAAYGLRILIMRRWPRGVARSDVDLWIPSAAPSEELLAAHRAGKMPWQDFTIAYRACQIMAQTCRVFAYLGQGKPTVQVYACRALDHLHELERVQGSVTLLCWEAEEPCHRFTLKELLENPAIEAEMRASLLAGDPRAYTEEDSSG